MEDQHFYHCSCEDAAPTHDCVPPSETREERRVAPSSNSEPFVDDESDEDYEIGSSRHKKKARTEAQTNEDARPRIETVQIPRLVAGEDIDAGHGSDEDSCMQDADFEDDGPPVLERVVPDEQAAADLQEIRGMWELAAVYEFLVQFKYWLNFSQLYPVQDLEEAIVRSPGPGLLAQLHVDLLHGIATRSQVGQDNWASTLAARLISEANAMQQPLTSLPFKPVRGKEAAGYAALSARQRVLTLKALADMRADREDMRILVDDIMRTQPGSSEAGAKRGASGTNSPPRRSARGSSAPPPTPTYSAEDMRGRGPLGCDAAGCRYYWFDMPYDHDAPVGLMGSRLYVEGPPRTPTSSLEEKQQQRQGLPQQPADKPPGKEGGVKYASAAEPDSASKPHHPPARPMADNEAPLPDPDTHKVAACSSRGSPEPAGNSHQQMLKQGPPEQQLQIAQAVSDAEQSKQNSVKQEPQEQQQQGTETRVGEVEEREQAGAAFKQENGKAGDTATADDDSKPTDDNTEQCTAVASDADAPPASAAAPAGWTQTSKPTGRAKKRPAADEAADDSDPDASADGSDAAAAQTSNRKKKSRASSDRADTVTGAAAAGLLPARPGRKAAAEAAAKVAQQLGRKAVGAAGDGLQHLAAPATPPAAKKPPRGSKKPCASSKACSAAASEEADSPRKGAQQQLDTDAADAALAISLGRSRPTRRAAADASAKIAAQAQNPPIYKLAENAAVAAAAASKAADGSSKSGKARRAGSEAGIVKVLKPVGEDYVLPADEVAGSWQLAADSVEGLEALAHELSERDDEADVALGRLLLEQVVATLLERKEREEKYARARSRVAKSLGLDAPAAESGRPQRQRRKPATYNFEDYDRSMRRAILAAERGEFEELPASGREPYKAPPYDIEVRRGRSGGAAEPAPTLEEIEAMRKRRIELAKLGLLETDHAPNQQEGQEQMQQEPQQQRQEADKQAPNIAHPQQPPSLQHPTAGDQKTPAAVDHDRQMLEQPADVTAPPAAAANPTAKELLASAGGVPQPHPRKQAPANRSSWPGGSGAPKPRKPAAPKPRPAQPAPPPSAWQIAAAATSTASAIAAATADGGGASGGRPRRRAAAGVAAAVAAAAAAAGGREEDFLGMASHMQSEWEAHHGADHTGQAGVPHSLDAALLDGGDGLLQRGHFHSTSTQSINGMAEPRDVNRQQLQQQEVLQPSLLLQGQAVLKEPVGWGAGAQQHVLQQQPASAVPPPAPAAAAWQPAHACEPVLSVLAAAAAPPGPPGGPQKVAAEQGMVPAGAVPSPAAQKTTVQVALEQLQAIAAGGAPVATEASAQVPPVNMWANSTAGFEPAVQVAPNVQQQSCVQSQDQQLHENQFLQYTDLQQQQGAGPMLAGAQAMWRGDHSQQQQLRHQGEQQQSQTSQEAAAGFSSVLPGIPAAAGTVQPPRPPPQQQMVLQGIPITAAAPQFNQLR